MTTSNDAERGLLPRRLHMPRVLQPEAPVRRKVFCSLTLRPGRRFARLNLPREGPPVERVAGRRPVRWGGVNNNETARLDPHSDLHLRTMQRIAVARPQLVIIQVTNAARGAFQFIICDSHAGKA